MPISRSRGHMDWPTRNPESGKLLISLVSLERPGWAEAHRIGRVFVLRRCQVANTLGYSEIWDSEI